MPWLRGALLAIFVVAIVTILVAMSARTPMPLASLSSGSMRPALDTGDAAVVLPSWLLRPTIGSIIVFRSDDQSGWTAHRVVGGSLEAGFLTKGDANNAVDQSGGSGAVYENDIVGVVPEIAGLTLKLPRVGLFALALKNMFEEGIPAFVPITALGLAAIVVAWPGKPRRTSMRKAGGSWHWPVLAVGGLFLLLMMSSLTLASVRSVSFQQPVGPNESRDPLASTTVEADYVLWGHGVFPLITVSQARNGASVEGAGSWVLNPGSRQQVRLTAVFQESQPEMPLVRFYSFLPLLPAGILESLVDVGPVLASVLCSLVVAVPMMLLVGLCLRMLAPRGSSRRRHSGGLRVSVLRSIRSM